MKREKVGQRGGNNRPTWAEFPPSRALGPVSRHLLPLCGYVIRGRTRDRNLEIEAAGRTTDIETGKQRLGDHVDGQGEDFQSLRVEKEWRGSQEFYLAIIEATVVNIKAPI